MLVLSRKTNERITCRLPAEAVRALAEAGEELRLTVTVCGAAAQRVRLGFEAPRALEILRDDCGPKKEAPRDGEAKGQP